MPTHPVAHPLGTARAESGLKRPGLSACPASREIFADLYLDRISEEEAEQRLMALGAEALAYLLVDLFDRAGDVRPLFCGPDGEVI
jgi:hypothetical protein